MFAIVLFQRFSIYPDLLAMSLELLLIGLVSKRILSMEVLVLIVKLNSLDLNLFIQC